MKKYGKGKPQLIDNNKGVAYSQYTTRNSRDLKSFGRSPIVVSHKNHVKPKSAKRKAQNSKVNSLMTQAHQVDNTIAGDIKNQNANLLK